MRILENFELTKKQVNILLICILILSFSLRFYNVGNESIWHDEALSIKAAKGNLSEIIQFSSKDTHPPLHFILLHYWIKFFGDSESSTRSLSVLYGIISVFIIYLIGKELFNKEVGIISSLILSINLYDIKYSQEVRAYSLMVLLALASYYYFIKLIKNTFSKGNVLGYVVATAMLLYTHVFGLFYLIIQNLYYFLYGRNYKVNTENERVKNNSKIRNWIITQLMITFLFLVWVPFLLHQAGTARLSWIPYPKIEDILYVLQAFSGNEQLFYGFVIVIIGGLISFKDSKYKENESFNILIFSWLLIPILMSFIISYIVKPIFWDRFLISSLPALILLLSYSIKELKNRFLINVVIILLIVFTIPILIDYYNSHQKEQWRDVASYIDQNKKTDDIILFYTGYGIPGFEYYYKNHSELIGINGAYEIKNYRKNHGIWLIVTELWIKNYIREASEIQNELNMSYSLKEIRQYNFMTIYYYEKLKNGFYTIYLHQKDKNMNIINNGRYGIFNYYISKNILRFSFEGIKLKPLTDYTLMYANASDGTEDIWRYIKNGKTEKNGHIYIQGKVSICNNRDTNIKIRLVNQNFTQWNMNEYLFEDGLISC